MPFAAPLHPLRSGLAAAVLGACAAFVPPQAATAQSELPPGYLSGALLFDAGEDPDAALARLDAALADLAAAGEPDPRIVFDIYRQQAEILAAAGRRGEAGQILRALADYARGHRDVVPQSPATLLAEAAEHFEAAGTTDLARDALEALVEEQRDGGLPGEAIAGTYRRLAALERGAGNTDAAGAYEAAAAEAETAEPAATRGGDEDHVEVDVHYATDRGRTDSEDPARLYGHARANGLSYGVATVSIPRSHRPGIIDKPSLWRAEFGLSPSKHVMLQSVEPLGKEAFFGSLGDAVRARDRKEIFVFIHGYNVTFEQAAKRAAQIAYDMNFSGLPVLYSWPSRGLAMGYIRDTAVVRLSGRRLLAFLDDLVEDSGADHIHIVAHSMGNRALTDALELMALRRGVSAGDAPVFDQIVFAAPDVDADLFAAMMPTIRPLARRLTLYASQQDWALFASRKLHGDAPRAGQAGEDVLVASDFDSVDMSLLGSDMLAHSYFSSALLDLYTLFSRDLDPPRRCGLEPAEARGDRSAWRYVPDACDEENLLNVLHMLSRQSDLSPEQIERMLVQIVDDPQMAADLSQTLVRMFPE